MNRWLACMIALLLGLVACGSDDDGVTPDAGPIPSDAGMDEEDAGPVEEDDAGPVEEDAGPVEEDAGPMCLDTTTMQGMYNTALGDTGCDDFIDFADQMIDPTVGGGACDITFTSIEAKGTLAINGDATVDADGNFGDTTLQNNGADVTCSGAWNATDLTMTLTCGACTITLTQFDDEV